MFYQYGSACYVALDDRKVHFIEERSKGGSHANNETELTNLLHVALWWKCFVWQPGFHMACPKSRVNQRRPHEIGLTRCCKLARPRIYFNKEKPNLSCMVCFTQCSQVSSLTCKQKKKKKTTQTKLTFCSAFDSFISYTKREADTSHSYRVYSMKLMQLVGDQWHSMIISEEDCNKVIINKYR
jgi:hypothetical protein